MVSASLWSSQVMRIMGCLYRCAMVQVYQAVVSYRCGFAPGVVPIGIATARVTEPTTTKP